MASRISGNFNDATGTDQGRQLEREHTSLIHASGMPSSRS